MSKELSIVSQSASVYSSGDAFEQGQRVAKMLSQTSMVPKDYQGNIANCLVALEMANRIGTSPLMVMQNLHIIHGRPSWSATYLIACINTSGKFSPLRFQISGEGDERQCVAVAKDLASGEILDGPAISIGMAKKEGWFSKTGSKWQTMPDLMLRYRAAAFFSRMYAPEVAMGLLTADEVQDVAYTDVTPQRPASVTITSLNDAISSAPPPSVPAPAKSVIEDINAEIMDGEDLI
ncbi:MAG: hypothetical protein ACR2K1_11670 [Saprospiraceae bacterium]